MLLSALAVDPATNTSRAHISITMGENPEFNQILPNTDYEKV